jgi:peroxiredoxin Q/BCP
LNFPILSDESLGVIKAYDAWGEKKFLGKTFDGILRKSYLINPEGKIVKEYPKVNVLVHAGEILNDIKEMSV